MDINFANSIIESNEFKEQNAIHTSLFSKTILALKRDSQTLYAMRSITLPADVPFDDDKQGIFIDICKRSVNLSHPCCMPISFTSLPDKSQGLNPAIYTLFTPNKSLQDVIEKQESVGTIEGMDNTQEKIVLYGVSRFLSYIHRNNQVHGRLKASNILLDTNFYPLVSDAFFYELNQSIPNKGLDKPIDYLVCLSKESLLNEPMTPKSDIYSFGIIALQILTHQINVFSNISNEAAEIEQHILNGVTPVIPDYIKGEIRNLIEHCLSEDPNQRPSAVDVVNILKKELSNEKLYNKARLEAFNQSLNPKNTITDPQILQYKEKADRDKDPNMMYAYGRARYFGENCTSNTSEGLHYLNMAKKKGHAGAAELYDVLRLNTQRNIPDFTPSSQISATSSVEQAPDQVQPPPTQQFVHLMNDAYFEKEKIDVNKIVDNVKKNYDKPRTVHFENQLIAILKERNFVFTDEAQKRLTTLFNYLEVGIPVLLEGPTGTSKTLSSEIVCDLSGRKLIRFNLSSETKSADLLGRYVGDSNSWAGISHLKGPFITAFEEGHTLLLDEINLASPECLQFIEETLDSGIISVELPGMPLREIHMHENFRLIATQNPNKGLFAHKRQDLGTKFLSRFQVIDFPAFTQHELIGIAYGLAKGFKCNCQPKLIEDLVDFHMEWSKRVIDDVQCFTVREIAATIRAIADNENVYETIMTIYGARYPEAKREELKKLFMSYQSFKFLTPDKPFYPNEFPKCFQNPNLSRALKSVLFSFKNKRHVILSAAEGVGVTQFARWVAQYYDIINNIEQEKNKNQEFFCVCSEETKCSDLIGRQKPSETMSSSNELIKWKNGFLTKAIKKGRVAVLDSIDEAPATVTERLNGLLDQKYDGKPKYFEVPENPKKREVEINKNFRLLCTCKIDKISQMSPAFINRFDVIVLENQLKNITANDLKELVKFLLQSTKFIDKSKSSQNIQEQNDNDLEDQLDDDDFDDGWGGQIDIPRQEVAQIDKQEAAQQEEAPIEQFVPTQEQINLVYNNIDSNMTMLQISQFCHAVARYIKFFEVDKGTCEAKLVIEFAKDMLKKNEDFSLSGKYDKLRTFLTSHLQQADTNDDNEFFYADSPLLCEFIAKLYAASLINLPVCVYGPTGAGKTSAARAFARIRPCNSKSKFQMHSFHSGTKPNHFYGTTTIKDRKIYFINGTLTTALSRGDTFIADEMNLSTPSTMKSLAAALEPCIGQTVYIPGVGEEVTINPEFFFIACQNEVGTIGRNAIPPSIASRFRYFDYPKQEVADISSICLDISLSFYKVGQVPSFTKEEAKKVGEYMIGLNNLQQRILPKWSLRDVTKLFQRIRFQDINSYRFINMDIKKNILFYTMSPVNQEDTDEILPIVIDLIGTTFGLNGPERQQLQQCYKDTPKVSKQKQGTYIMKGNCGVMYEELSNSTIEYKLTSLLHGIFLTSLSDESEPILLMGPSGFKTFLAERFLPSAQVITLNQESTIAQLLGSSAFLTDSEAKVFYLDQICKICQIESLYPQFNESLKKDKLQKEDITKCINFDKIPMSFSDAAKSLINKLFSDDKNKQNKSVISNITLEFRPGLFLSAILQGKSLILKNLSNLPTIVLERFNELFSGKHNLTLNEDIHNTFTSEISKELTNFSANFRVFATCPPNSATKLSEAVLSRFSVICIPSYMPEEQEMVLNSYILFKQLTFDPQLIPLIISFSQTMANHQLKSFTFTQMINVVEMCAHLNRKSENKGNTSNHHSNLCIILYRLALGLLEKRKHNQGKLLAVFDEISLPLPDQIKSPMEQKPLVVTRQNEIKGIKSNFTGYFIESASALEEDDKNSSKLSFTGMFSEMLDVLHLGLSANIPVIFEGMPGQGKQTAINYIAKLLGYNVINIIISQATKVEDLLGKVTITRDADKNIHVDIIKTKLVKAFNSDADSNSIIVFHNINNASPAVLEVLVTIFNRNIDNILLPNGSPMLKGQLNLVGIFNPQSGMFNRDRLPSSLVFSSLYHIVNDPKSNDIFKIIQELFLHTKFKDDATSFFEKYEKTKQIANDNNATPLTLNDIVKYILFREQTYGKFDEATISQMIFAYRYLEQEVTAKVLEEIGLSGMKFIPSFTYNTESQEIFIRISEDMKTGITLSLKSNNIDTQRIQSAITCLTLPQKHCLLFLACALLSKRSCILQGGTASGKSHIIRLFAEMLGQKLNVYQMNRDTGVSILTGQSVLSNNLTADDVKAFRRAFADLKNINEFNEYIESSFPKNYEEWKPSMFSELLDAINDYQTRVTDISEMNLKYLNSAEALIRQTILPANRFHPQESSFTRAMIRGEWVLIDGIESAPPEIAEKISSLCGDNPELDLLECGDGFYFTKKDLPNSQKIHDNFHLFVTYNPLSSVETKIIDPVFLNKCVSFTLPQMDSTPEYTAQIILGSLLRSSYPVDFATNIGARIGNMHNAAKKESVLDRDSFAGDITLTGRTVKFVSKEFNHFAQKLSQEANPEFTNSAHKPICYSMEEFYWNSFIDKNKADAFKKKMLAEFSNEPSYELIQSLHCHDSSPKDRNESLLVDLRNIQKYATQSIPTLSFSFSVFVNKCLLVRATDVPYVLQHIQDTIDIIDQSDMPNKFFSDLYENQYSQLNIIRNMFKEVADGMTSLRGEDANLSLNDPDLLKQPDLEKPLSKLLLLSQLVSDNSAYFSEIIPSILFNNEICGLLRIIISMTHEFKMSLFDTFVSKLESNRRNIPLIESIFPYNYFVDTRFEMISYWLPLFRELHESKTTFHVIILDHKYDFTYSKKSEYEPTYIFRENEELVLSPGSQFQFHKPENEAQIPPYSITANLDHSKLVLRSSLFYGLTKYLIQNPRDITLSTFQAQFPKYRKRIPNPRMDQLAKYSLLFNRKEARPSLIAKAWSIAYAFPYDLIDIIFCYMHPLEAETTQAIMHYYQLISKKNIDQLFKFSKWMLNFGSEQSVLWRIKNNTFDVDLHMNNNAAKRLIQEIDTEIKNLNDAPEINKEIWSKDRYITDLENAKIPINDVIKNIIINNQDLQLKHLMHNLIEKLQKEKITKKQHDRLRQIMITQITKASEQKLTQEKVENYQNEVTKFLQSVTKEESSISQNSIMWPTYTPSKPLGSLQSDTMRLYQHILWFSYINSICDKIIDPQNPNVFESVVELGEFVEIQPLANMLISRITNSGVTVGSPFLPDEIDIMQSTVRAVFISKLYKDKLIDNMYHLDEVLNSLEDRDHINDERDIEWIHKIASQYSSDFNIVLPKFDPRDLLLLYVGYAGINEKANPGPIIGKIQCTNVIESLKLKVSNEFDGFISCSDMIAKQIYRILIDPKGAIPKDHNDLKKLLSDNCPKMGDERSLVRITLEVMKIAENMSKIPKFHFKFNDTAFLKPNWIKNTNFVDNYPSLVYWLCKNQRLLIQLQNFFGKCTFNPDELPFWLFAIRLMSSEDCIKFDYKADTNLSKIISKTVEDSIKLSLHDHLNNHKPIGTKWLNIILSSVPPEIAIANYRLFYQFLVSLSEDNKNGTQFVEEKKSEVVKTFTQNACNMLFDDKVDEFLNLAFDTNTADLSFVKDPNKYIESAAQSNISSIFTNFLNSKEFNTLISFKDQNQSAIDSLINDISATCDIEEEAKRVKYEKMKIQNRAAELDRLERDIQKTINDYNNLIDNLNEPKILSFSDVAKLCKKLLNLRQKLPDNIEDLNKPGISFYELTCPDLPKKARIEIQDMKGNIHIKSLNEIMPMYFKYTSFDETSIKNAVFLRKDIPISLMHDFQFYEMHQTSDYFNITQFCNEKLNYNYSDENNYDTPVLILGNNMNKADFIHSIRIMNISISDQIRTLQTTFQNTSVEESLFTNSREFEKSLFNFNSTLTKVKFSTDNDPCHLIAQKLRDLSLIFKQYHNLIGKINKYLTYNVYNQWKMFNNQNNHEYDIFKNQYKLPIPVEQNLINYGNLFRNIINVDYLSSAILNSENGQITCCFNSLYCQIKPIIPALYSKSIALNFISFIEEPISISIETEQQYSNWFNPGHYSEQSDIVQIFVNLPAVTSDKIEEYKVPTRIHFTSPSLKELILPCDFSFTLLPLSILINCKQYPLSFNETDNTFILCTDRITSNSKLTFSLKYFNSNDQNLLTYQLASLENNKCQKPEPSNNANNDCIELSIPNVDTAQRLNCALKIAFSEHFKTSIIIDAAIIPFQFDFDAYDYHRKTYLDRVTINYSRECLNRPITLHCRLYSTSFAGGVSGEIRDQLPSAVVIQNYGNITKKFNISSDMKFDIILKMNQVVSTYATTYSTTYRYQQKTPIYSISVIINGIEKNIILEFAEVKNEIVNQSTEYFNTYNYLRYYPVYAYNHKTKDWNRIETDSYEKPSSYHYIISPFNYILRDQVTVTYDNSYSKEYPCTVSARNQNKFICLTNVGLYYNELAFQSSLKFVSKSHRIPLFGYTFGKDSWSAPIIGLYREFWYPVFKDYPQEPFDWLELEIDDSNISIAQDRINKLPKKSINTRASNFLYFYELLKLPLVIMKIDFWTLEFPDEIKMELNNTIQNIRLLREDDPKLIIFSHNLIHYFCVKFLRKFEEIRNNSFSIMPFSISKNDILSQMDKLYNELTAIDPHAENISPTYNKYKKIQDSINSIQIPAKPSEQSEAFLFTESSKPIPKKRTDAPEIVTPKNDNAQSTISMSNVEIKLPKISIPNETDLNTLTLSSLNNIYLQCLQGTRLLPIYVFNMRKQKSMDMEAEASNYFLQLYNVFKDLPIKDHSFISTAANLFISSFATMVGKFKKAGCDIQQIVSMKCQVTEVSIQDFIQYPEKDKPFMPQEIWNVFSNDIFTTSYQNMPIAISPSVIGIDDKHLEIDDDIIIHDDNNDEQNVDSSITIIDTDDTEQSNIEYMRVMTEYSQNIKDRSDDDDDDQLEDGFKKPTDPKVDKPKPPSVVIVKPSHENQKTKVVNTNTFDGMAKQFTEKDGIERAIRRMQEMNKNGNLKITNTAPHEFKEQYLKPDNEQYTIASLMTQSFYLAQEFIKAASDQEIPYSSIAANILVDCSSFISDENKTFNMLIICGLTHALNALEIPYSAAVIADENFKCVIKPFGEPHSLIALQRIYDCLMIKRYRTKLASSMKFAIGSMNYRTNPPRPYRAIFTLTDGLDDQLVLTKAWADSILTDEKISFGFVFIKSAELTDQNLQFLEQVWKDFETEVKSYNARSVVKIASIDAIYGKAVADKLSTMFAIVMKRLTNPNSSSSKVKYEKPKFESKIQLSKVPLDHLSRYLESDLENIRCGVYIENTQVLKKANIIHEKPDSSFYRSKLGKILDCQLDQSLSKIEYESFLRNFIESRRKLNQAALETIFKPNKASQTVLSTTGTDFDITALILNLINPVPDPLIYLEEKGGLVRNYGVSVIIDPSISCFHELSAPHSLQTIRNILSSIASLDLPCFDLIVAGNKEPLVLCSEVGTNRATNIKSSLWQSLISVLQTPLPSVDLASAIHAALDLRLMRSTEHSSILLVLTDGLFEENERGPIVDAVNSCVQSGMNTFGIGIGIYPRGIDKLFPQIVYSPNPSNVMKGIASIYGDSLSNQLTEWPSISYPHPDENSSYIHDVLVYMIQKSSTPCFQSLRTELHDIMPSIDAFDDMYNEEQDIGNDKEGYNNPVGKNTELYVKDLLKSQKILIVMLWDYTMNEDEEERFVHPDYIFKSSQPKRSECIQKAVEHYGIELKVVQDYDAAITELTKQTRPGYCDYYAVWVFCGPPYPVLPNKKADPNLVGDFNEVLIKFWKNGGSIVFMAEGGEKEQLTYQANLFLRTVTFEQELLCPSGKTKLQLVGEHAGNKVLLPDTSDTLSKKQTFNRSPQIFKQCQRSKLSHNIGKIFEGITISYAPYDLELIKPFRPFARDSEGGISTLFYPANIQTGTGDIIIDCGFTKCFTKMTTDGTFRYIQNIAGWTARPEVHKRMDPNFQPCDWRPKAISHTTKKGRKWDNFKEIPKPPVVPTVDPTKLPRNLWCIDSSGSVRGDTLYHGQLSRILAKYRKSNDEYYFWASNIQASNYNGVLSFISNKKGSGGTSSELIADIAKGSKIRDHLIIITDGCVNSGSVDKSDLKMKSYGIQFQYVTTYIIGSGGDLSVGAPYCRGCPNVTFKVLKLGVEMPQASLSAQDMATLQNIDKISSYSQFSVQYKNLENAIQANMLGTNGDKKLQNQLASLSSRIKGSGISSSNLTDFNKKIHALQRMAQGALRDTYTLEGIGAALRK